MVNEAMLQAGIANRAIQRFVDDWAELTQPDQIEVISAADDARLLAEAVHDGELLQTDDGNYYARSHPQDTARSEQRTVVATSNPADQGIYNNWRHADTIMAQQRENMRAAFRGKTMYVIPYLMAVPHTRLANYAAGVQLTDDRTVVLHMLRMARVGIDVFETLEDPEFFVRGVHVTGDLTELGQGTADDRRLFATVADQRLILHYGSAYGGNALLGKIAHALRQASYDGWNSGRFLAEQFMLLGVADHATGETYHICGGFPSASGKTNLAMMLPPEGLEDRYSVKFYGDDIAWLWAGEDGRLYAMNPENGIFGVAKDTNHTTNPAAMESIQPGSGAIFTNVARHEETGKLWWEGKTPQPPEDITGWRDWKGDLISQRKPEERDDPWAHPNSRFATSLVNIPTLAVDADDPAGVPIDAIIFGGRTRAREPLIRAMSDPAEGVYDGLTLGAEATFAAEGLNGQLRYDPMSMRPFMSYPEGDYAEHWLNLLAEVTHPPVFAHVNWFQRDDHGTLLWPGYRQNLRALVWLLDYSTGKVKGTQTPVGVVPQSHELPLDGLDLDPERLEHLLHVDTQLWREEMRQRGRHLDQFALPAAITAVHQRIDDQFDNNRFPL